MACHAQDWQDVCGQTSHVRVPVAEGIQMRFLVYVVAVTSAFLIWGYKRSAELGRKQEKLHVLETENEYGLQF